MIKTLIDREGQSCRHCNTPVILRECKFKKKKLKKNYYYTKYYYCVNCKAMYMHDDFKVYIHSNRLTDISSKEQTLFK